LCLDFLNNYARHPELISILSEKVNGKTLVYSITELPPKPVVIDAISKYYQEINANIHRRHTLSQLATDAYEISRGKNTEY
jgi:cysteine desulfurase/selenocysteine lyase